MNEKLKKGLIIGGIAAAFIGGIVAFGFFFNSKKNKIKGKNGALIPGSENAKTGSENPETTDKPEKTETVVTGNTESSSTFVQQSEGTPQTPNKPKPKLSPFQSGAWLQASSNTYFYTEPQDRSNNMAFPLDKNGGAGFFKGLASNGFAKLWRRANPSNPSDPTNASSQMELNFSSRGAKMESNYYVVYVPVAKLKLPGTLSVDGGFNNACGCGH